MQNNAGVFYVHSEFVVGRGPSDIGYPRNARLHSRKQIKQIANSIQEFGFTCPLLIDEESTVLAGHGRLAAAMMLNMKEVPCVVLSKMSAAQKRAYVLADNKLVLNGTWDEEILATELQSLLALDCAFDVDLTGFSVPEIDRLIDGLKPSDDGNPADDWIPVLSSVGVSRSGDLWILGPHKILCGNALDDAAFETLMGKERAEMVFTDPPYNVPVDGHVGGLGKIRHRKFAMASGEMSKSEFTDFLRAMMRNLVRYSTDGSIHFQCMDWRHLTEILATGEGPYTELKNICVWVKDNDGMGTFYRSRHELLLRGIVNRAANGEPRATKQALDLMREYGLLKIEDVEHHVTVELVKSVERRGGRAPQQKAPSKPFAPLKPRKN